MMPYDTSFVRITLRSRLLPCLLATVACMTLAPRAFGEDVDKAAEPAEFDWDRGSTTVVVSYREIWGELAGQDSVPLIRVYGNGRVLVHRPAYLLGAGDYEAWLQPAELQDLLASLIAKNLTTIEKNDVERLKTAQLDSRLQSASKTQTPTEIYVVADDLVSVFEINLIAVDSGELQREIVWRGLETDARNFPDIEQIQQLRAAELQLRSLLDRDDLWKVR